MNAIIHCDIRLSKKLEKLVEAGEAIEIYIGPIKDGGATGMVKITTKNGVTLQAINEMGETNIIMRTPQAEELAPNLGTDEPVQTIFSDGANEVPQPPQQFQQVPPNLNPNPANQQYVQASYPNSQIAITNPDSSPVLQRPVAVPSNKPTPKEMDNLQRHLVKTGNTQWPPLPRQEPPQGRSAPVDQARQAQQQYLKQAYPQQPPPGYQFVQQPQFAPPQPQPQPQPQQYAPQPPQGYPQQPRQPRQPQGYPQQPRQPQQPQGYQQQQQYAQQPQYAQQQYAQQPQYIQQPQYDQQPQYQQYAPPPIMSYDELMAELQNVPDINQPVPNFQFQGMPGSPDERQAMLAFEQTMAQLPKLQRPCYIRNDVAGRLEIQDLGYTMLLNQVLDLSRMPARRIWDSRHLRELCNGNYLTFVTYDDLVASLEAPDPVVKSYLPVGSATGKNGDPEVEGFAVDGGSADPNLYIDRHHRVTTAARRKAGMRRAGYAEFADEGEPLIDPEFAELVSDLPSERMARQQYQQPQRWQPPAHQSAKAKPVARVGAESGDFYIDSQDIYSP